MLYFKPGAIFAKVHPKLLVGLIALAELFETQGIGELMITSGTDGVHMQGSFHGVGQAVDIRSKTIPPAKVECVVRLFRATNDADYDLLWEFRGLPNEHLHLEYDPKSAGNSV